MGKTLGPFYVTQSNALYTVVTEWTDSAREEKTFWGPFHYERAWLYKKWRQLRG